MSTKYEALTGEEIVCLIAALDAFIGAPEDQFFRLPDADRERLMPYTALRRRLKANIGVSFYDRAAAGWLDGELARERDAFATDILSLLYQLLEDPKATRRTLKQDFGRRLRQLAGQGRFSTPRPLS